MKNQKFIKFFPMIAIILLIGFMLYGIRFSELPIESVDIVGNQENRLPVKTQVLKSGQFFIPFEVHGLVKSPKIIDIIPLVSGRIVDIHDNFKSGNRLQSNTIFFQIDPIDYEHQLMIAKNAYTVAKLTVSVEKAESKIVSDEWKTVYPNHQPSDLALRKPHLDKALANYKAAKSQVAQAKLALSRTAFQLPMETLINDTSLTVGQYVRSGQTYGSVTDISEQFIEIDLPHQWVKKLLSVEMPVKIYHNGKQVLGSLDRIHMALNDRNKFQKIYVKPNSPELTLGDYVKVLIEVSTQHALWKVPITALLLGESLWVVDNEKLTKWSPEILFQDREFAYIKSELPIGEIKEVVLNPSKGLVEGMLVQIQPNKLLKAAQ